jgi:uncharacterized protein DUF5906
MTDAQVGIPFVMTQAMRAALRERGLTDDAIAEMTPGEAHKLLGNGADHAPAVAEITVLTKGKGVLSKRIELVGGKIANDGSACSMTWGSARRVQIDIHHIATLAEIINKMTPRQAYSIGRLKGGLPDRVDIVTVEKLADNPGAIARSQDYFTFVGGEPAIALLDVDVKGVNEDAKRRIREQGVWAALCSVVPALATVARVVRQSTSHGLRHKETGATYPSSGGFHCAIVVADGADIPRFLSDLHDRLWIAGLGWGMISAAGSFLERALVDRACGTPERLIFEGPPIIVPPLEQGPRLAEAHEGAVLDTLTACPPLTATEKAEVDKLKAAERARLKPEGEATRAKWSEGHVKRIVATGMPEPWARAQVARWLDKQELSGDFPLPFDDGKLAGTTVATVLGSPDKFLNRPLADPFEGPAYGRGKARIYRRDDGSLLINSFAHGGVVYELKQAPRPDVEAEVERLSRLSIIDYDLARDDATKRLGIRVVSLDKMVEAKRRELNPPDLSQQDAILAELNRDNSVVMIGAKTRVLRFEDVPHVAAGEHYVHRLPTFVRFDDFRNFYLNRLVFTAQGPTSIGHWWLEHPKRNHYRGVVFHPGGPPVIDGFYNLWTGWGVAAKSGDWSLMKKHIFEVLAAGDVAVFDYIMNWLADAVQHPDRQAEVTLVFSGGGGTGKGLLGRAMVRIFGQHGRHVSSPEHLTGKFNAHLQQCCFLFADEAAAPQDKKAEGALKRLITEDTLFIEPKGLNAFEVPNRLSVMMASNHDWVVPAAEKERRHMVQDVADHHQQDEAWFKPIYKECATAALRPCCSTFSPATSAIGARARSCAPPRSAGRWMKASLLTTGGGASFC